MYPVIHVPGSAVDLPGQLGIDSKWGGAERDPRFSSGACAHEA